MEDMFMWMLIAAGATIGLLGTFLISSERELKRKRRQLETLAADMEEKLGAGPDAARAQSPGAQSETELLATNTKLTAELESLKSALQAAQIARDRDASAREQLSAMQSENTELRQSTERLQKEVALLQNQLDSGHAQISQSSSEHQVMSEQRAELEAKNREIQAELEQSRQTVAKLETMQAHWRELESREPQTLERQRQLEAEITGLRSEIGSARQDLETARTRLNENEAIRRQLVDDHSKLQQEISGWQERLARSEEGRRQFGSFCHNVEELRAKQGAATEAMRQLQEGLDALARLIENQETTTAADRQALGNGENTVKDAQISPSETTSDSDASGTPAADAGTPKKRMFGLFSPVLILAIGTGLRMTLLR